MYAIAIKVLSVSKMRSPFIILAADFPLLLPSGVCPFQSKARSTIVQAHSRPLVLTESWMPFSESMTDSYGDKKTKCRITAFANGPLVKEAPAPPPPSVPRPPNNLNLVRNCFAFRDVIGLANHFRNLQILDICQILICNGRTGRV